MFSGLHLAQPSIVEQRGIYLVAGDLRDRVLRQLIAVFFDDGHKPRPHLAGRTPDHAVKLFGWYVESFDISSPQKIRTAHNTESFFLESVIEDADAGENRQHESHASTRRRRCSSSSIDLA